MNDKKDEALDNVEPIKKKTLPSKSDYTGKLPEEFIQEWMKDKDEFKKLWKECQSFDIQKPFLIELGFDEPFLGSLSRRILKVRSAFVPTAGVTVNNNGLVMLWNPIFFAKTLTNKQVPGIIKHELFHIIFEHITTRRQKPHVLWNVATDLAINSLIPRDELPDFCLFPGELYTPPNPPKDWQPGLIARLISTLPKEKSSEWYMNFLLNNEEVKNAMEKAKAAAKEKCKKSGSSSSGQGGGDSESSGDEGEGDEKFDRTFNKELENELFGGAGGQFDDHDMWDELSDEQKDMMRDYIRDMFRDCVREAESSSNGWGHLPASMQAYLKKIISKEINWSDLLNLFIGRSKSVKTTSSIKRINRRYPWEHPGRKRSYRARPMLAIDQSGSMTDWWVELLFAEVANLGSLTEYIVLPFDYVVDENNIQIIKRGQQPNPIRTCGGGTNFDAPVQYVNSHPGEVDALIILTDGGCSAPSKCDIPLAYVLAPGCELCFDPGTIPVIKMTDTRKSV
jgi:predicted metal-dependent peptidase